MLFFSFLFVCCFLLFFFLFFFSCFPKVNHCLLKITSNTPRVAAVNILWKVNILFFLLFEVEATGSYSTYPFNHCFSGAQFYFTQKQSNIPVSVSFNCLQFISLSMSIPSIYLSSSLCVSLVVFYFSDFEFNI